MKIFNEKIQKNNKFDQNFKREEDVKPWLLRVKNTMKRIREEDVSIKHNSK